MNTPADFPMNGAIARGQSILGRTRFFTAEPLGTRLEFLSS